MKTWEMIKKLTENPEKEFACNYGKAIRLGDKIIWAKTGKIIELDYYTLSAKWEEVKAPVPWQEAIQAWIDGKGFRIEMPNGKIIHQSAIEAFGIQLRTEDGDFNAQEFGIMASCFIVGKWYIED